MGEKRRKYNKQFKLDALQLYENGEKSLSEVERELGITSGLLGKWREELSRAGSPEEAFPGNGRLPDSQERSRQLELENAQLHQEKEIMKIAGDQLQGYAMKYNFIEKHQAKLPVSQLCRALRVSRSGYYAWRKRQH